MRRHNISLQRTSARRVAPGFAAELRSVGRVGRIGDQRMSRISFVRAFVGLAALTLACGGCTSSVSDSVDSHQRSGSGRKSQMFRVPSKDGTLIAVECAGAGPTLVLVHGGIGDRSRWTPMFPLLSSHFTVCAMDRRGHGESGDSSDYSLRKEAEDVAAVVDSRPGIVFVLGHSYGGVAALEAMFLTHRISKLVLYEPPVQDPVEHNLAVADTMERMIKEGARDQAAVLFMTEVVRVSPGEVEAMKARQTWPDIVATIGSQVRQIRALATYRFDANRMRTLRQPTLLLTGSDTTSQSLIGAINSLQAALPNATRVVLKGQQHNAMDSAREMLAKAIIAFLTGTTDPQTGRVSRRPDPLQVGN